jgi:hypothetical protein
MPAVKVPLKSWCQCQVWNEGHSVLINHDKMDYCAFCGTELVKVRQMLADVEQGEYTLPRAGYYYVGRLATPENLTVFHLLKDGEHQFLCGMDKPVGAVPPPNTPERRRCCCTCLEELKETPSCSG